jgi:hypothetical protein
MLMHCGLSFQKSRVLISHSHLFLLFPFFFSYIMDPITSSIPDPTSDQSIAARIGAAIAAAVANGQYGKSTSTRKGDKDRVKISFFAPAKMEQAFRYIALQLELRGEAVYTQEGLLLEMLRALLNYYALDKSMAHPILRNMKPPQS